MVYIYKKVLTGKSYYYLRASERRGQKVIAKDIAYLGNTVSDARKALNELPQYKKDIEKAYRKINLFLEENHFLEKVKEQKIKGDIFLGEQLVNVEACRLHYSTVFKKLDRLTQKQLMDNFIIEYSYNTTSIEGNTITLKEARDLLEDGLTPKGKTLREIYDLQNTKKVFENLNFKKDISHDLIKKIHSSLLEKIDLRESYRTKDIHVTHSRFEATPFYHIIKELDLLLEWYSKNKKILHPFVLAIGFHHQFEKIHPFFDGNGRTGRMLLNFILMKNNYPPLMIQNKNRSDYLDALSEADESAVAQLDKKHYATLINFVANELIGTYWNNFL